MNEQRLWFLPYFAAPLWIYIVAFIFLTYTVSSTFRFYIKYMMLIIYYCVWSVGIVVFSLPKPRSKANLHEVCQLIQWTDIVWGVEYNIKGQENYKKDSSYIIVANHQSTFDMNVALNCVPPKTTFLVKREALYIPFIGQFIWMCGGVFIDRKNHEKAMNTMKKVVDEFKKEKFNLWIFPEGTRHMGKKLLPFKKGAFYLAQQTEVPILPVVISNYEEIINLKRRRFGKGTIDVTFLPEIPTKGLTSDDVPQLTERVYSIMCKEYEKCSISNQSK